MTDCHVMTALPCYDSVSPCYDTHPNKQNHVMTALPCYGFYHVMHVSHNHGPCYDVAMDNPQINVMGV